MTWKGWEDYEPPAPMLQGTVNFLPGSVTVLHPKDGPPKLDRGRGRMGAKPIYVRESDQALLTREQAGLTIKGGSATAIKKGLRFFKSSKEAKYYVLLRLQQNAGAIKELRAPHALALHATAPSGTKVQTAVFNLDFSYYDVALQRTRYVDVKGNPRFEGLYLLKKKHAEIEYGITIEEV